MRIRLFIGVLYPIAAVHVAIAAVIHISVGGPNLTFTPNYALAQEGDIVSFDFDANGRNHSVVQGDPNKPCTPLDGGFSSGFVSPVARLVLSFVVAINDTETIWFYCAQANHCQSGMVGMINPNSLTGLDSYTIAAARAPENLRPDSKGPFGGVLFDSVALPDSSIPSPDQNAPASQFQFPSTPTTILTATTITASSQQTSDPSPDPSDPSRATKIGLGVAVPLGVIALGLFVWIGLKLGLKTHQGPEAQECQLPELGQSERLEPHELTGKTRRKMPNELHDIDIKELDSQGVPRELE